MSFFTNAINAVIKTVGLVGRKAKLSEIVGYIFDSLPDLLVDFASIKEAHAEDRVREFWSEFDDRTGIGGADIIHDLPPEAEERLFDGFGLFGFELSLWAIGYYGEKPSPADILQATRSMRDAVAQQVGQFKAAGNNDSEPPESGRTESDPDSEDFDVEQVRAELATGANRLANDRLSTLEKSALWAIDKLLRIKEWADSNGG